MNVTRDMSAVDKLKEILVGIELLPQFDSANVPDDFYISRVMPYLTSHGWGIVNYRGKASDNDASPFLEVMVGDMSRDGREAVINTIGHLAENDGTPLIDALTKEIETGALPYDCGR